MTLHCWRTSRSRLAAWLGILSIVLLFIAPVISKSLAESRASTTHSMSMPSHMGMDHSSMMMGHHSMSSMAGMSSHMSMMDDSACGYCVLLAHLSMAMMIVILISQRLPATRDGPKAVVSPYLPKRTTRPYHPRAPPLSFVL